MGWATACGPTRTDGLTLRPSPRATACGSAEPGPSCSAAFPRSGQYWSGPRSSWRHPRRKGARQWCVSPQASSTATSAGPCTA
eukprot:7489739-Alexandrium_andersonii.AAC.1